MVHNQSERKVRQAIAVVLANRGFNILKMSNVLVLFYRSLSGTISTTAHIIDQATKGMPEWEKIDWPFDKSIKVVDQAGATWTIDYSLLVG